MQKGFKKKVLNVISVDQYIELMSAGREFNKYWTASEETKKKPN
jgi:hypothetical protein